jgi:hypothetical protein
VEQDVVRFIFEPRVLLHSGVLDVRSVWQHEEEGRPARLFRWPTELLPECLH